MIRRLISGSRRVLTTIRNLTNACKVRLRYGSRIRYVVCSESGSEGLSDRWQLREPRACRLTIVVATYRQGAALECLLQSLACQTLQNFTTLIIHDGPDLASRQITESFSQRFPHRFEYLETPRRCNDYGHSSRQLGIERADTEFVLLTNGDNYYAPRFVEFMFEAVDRYCLDVVMCDMVHSHCNPGVRLQPSYGYFRTEPFVNYVDVGCFFAKTQLSRQVGFRDRSFCGDATYFADLMGTSKALVVGKVAKVLMVHN